MSSRIALLENNVVVNVIVGDIATYTPPDGVTAVADPYDEAEIEGSYVNGAFSGRPPPPPPPPKGPPDYPLSDRQLRIGLISSGISLDTIDQAIANIADATERAIAQVWWDRSTVIYWDHPMRVSLTDLLGLTEDQAAAMWMQAKDLAA